MNPRPPSSSADEPRTRSDDPDAPPGPRSSRTPRKPAGEPHSGASDEISVILSSAIAEPDPDPMLGGSSSWDLQRIAAEQAARESRVGRTDRLDIGVETSSPASSLAPDAPLTRSEAAPYSWSSVLLRSYASAVTMALVWVLWSGRTIPREPAPAPASRDVSATRRRAVEPAPAPSAAPLADVPASRTTTLGKSIVVDDLEVTPLVILHKSVRISRDLGEERLVRDHDGCLVLTLRLKNLSPDEAVRPLEAGDLTDGEAFAIESPPGPRLGLLAFDSGSEWTIDEQQFPTIEPGAVEDVVLVSEPAPRSRLGSTTTWRFRLRADAGRDARADVAVRFGRDEVHGDGF
ncbi:hypothetical protein [Paludisphaera soli]|uniref:hypothetical protein n=1 Tax=Paludisphaera soli TaxID=2712865 RepID=UPI0013ED4E2F|nr:hypothetical protein [Paludisphaera soli]